MSSKQITPVQRMVLDYMREFLRDNDQMPPMRSITDHFNWNHDSTAHYHIRALHQKGVIERNAVGKYRFAREATNA